MAVYNYKDIMDNEKENFDILFKDGTGYKVIHCLFIERRIERDSIPEGMFMYQVRHSDEDWSEPCEIKEGILVNFMGTLITGDEIPLFKKDEKCGDYLCVTTPEWDDKHISEYIETEYGDKNLPDYVVIADE